jgi:competence protein ComEA
MESITPWLDRFQFPLTIVLVAAILGGSGILVVRSLELRDVVAARTQPASADQLTLEELQRQQAELTAQLNELKTNSRSETGSDSAVPSPPTGVAAGERSPATAVTPPSTPSASELVHLNSASQAALETLPGIGTSKAQAILDYRTAHGGFKSIDELDNVKGIGEATLAKLKPHLTLD